MKVIGQIIRDINRQKQKEEFVDSCPFGVFKFDTKKELIEIEDITKCTYCGECKKKAEESFQKPRLISVNQKPKPKFYFTIESIGSLSPCEILIKAIDILILKLSNLEQPLMEIKI